MMRDFSRRAFLGGATAALLATGAKAQIPGPRPAADLDPALMRRALAAMHKHHEHLAGMDRLAVVDFGLPSRAPRMHLIDLKGQSVRSVLVAHGLGSDPDYTGWLTRFSNKPGSLASSAGSYVTGEPYSGKHGHSLRLNGLSETNSNAQERAIVIHSAWYVSKARAASSGKIGRSDGCFAVAETSLQHVLDHLGTGHFLYAEKLAKEAHV